MSIIVSARRRQADELQALLTGGRASSPAAAQDLAPLVALARGLSPVEHTPAPEFRAALRERLVAEAAGRVPVPGVPAQRARPTAAARFRQVVAAVAVASVVAGVGAAAASTRALPGDTLYGLKRQVEDVQLSLARGDVGRGRELLDQADARLSEAERLTAGEHAADPATRAKVGQSLADLGAAVTLGSDTLFRAYRETGDDEPLLLLDRFVADQRERLDDLLPLLGPTLRDRVRALADRLAAIGHQVSAVLGPTSTARALTREVLTASGDGWAVGRLVDRAAASATGAGAAAGTGSGGTTATGPGAGVDDAVDAVGELAGLSTGGTSSSGGSGGSGGTPGGGSTAGGVVGGLVGSGGTASAPQLPTLGATPLPTVSVVPVATSSPLVTDPVGTATGAVPLPTSTALPSLSACVPVPPLTGC